MSVNVTGLYSNGGLSVDLTNIEAETIKINQVLTSESSSILRGNTLVYGDLEVNDENIINKINVLDSSTTSNFSTINNNINLINTDISGLTHDFNTEINLINTDISGLTHHVDTGLQEQKDYTDAEIEQLRNEGYIQEAVTQIVAWIISDEGKLFRKKVWNRIKNKWLTFTSKRPYSELLDDIENAR